MNTYTITCFNEGQELNYVESWKGKKEVAFQRAEILFKQLKEAMTQGEVSVEVTDFTGIIIKEIR
jgi:hypothetical protein